MSNPQNEKNTYNEGQPDVFANVSIGDGATMVKTVSESDVYLYAGITGDFSPNHVDAEFMANGHYGERIAHGTLLLGFMSAASARLYLGRTVSQGYDRVRFIGAVRFGDTITTDYRVDEIDRVKKRIYATVTCTNQHSETVAVARNMRVYVG